jgi:hypothetical protein
VTTKERISIAVEEGRIRTRAARCGAGEAAIERAYKQLAFDCHPDRGGDPVTFRHLTAARDNLIARIANIEIAICNAGLEPTESKQ